MKKITDILTCVLFSGFLAVMLLLFVVLPKESFSDLEKRSLESFPKVDSSMILSGAFGSKMETFAADHVPGRSFFVGVSNYYDLLTGRQGAKDILVADGDRLVEKPNTFDEAAIQKNLKAIQGFSESIGKPVDLMIVPSAGYILEDTVQGTHVDYTDDEIIGYIYDASGLPTVDLLTPFSDASDRGALYYRTDHHWTSLGAYTALKTYLSQKGRTCPEQSAYFVTSFDGFYGTTYSRSGLWLTKADTVELWDDGGNYTVTAYQNASDTEGKTQDSLFYPERLEESDMYTVYLNGNQPLVRITNPEGQGKLLVIRDSYANCLGAFLASSYEEVVLVDLRYWKFSPVSELAAEGFDDVLVCYSLYNFLTDANIPLLR